MKKWSQSKPTDILIWCVTVSCLVLGALYIVAASPLNPKSVRLPDIDSSIFIYFGYGIRAGMTPYADMIDHKGPLLWTIEWLGLMLGNDNMTGIWYLEWVMMFVDLLLLFFCARFFIKNRALCLFAVAISVTPIVYLYQGGNFSEEWALPFILLALYIFLDYLKNQKLSVFRIIVCGACMGAVVCIRPNMIGVWIAFVLTVFIRMVLQKDWKLIGKCVLGFVGGIGLIIIPYIMYYASKGALYDMWEWSILKNVSYVQEGKSSIISKETIQFFLKKDSILYVPIMLAAIVALLRKRFDWIWGAVIFYLVSLLLCTMGGRTMPHYAMVLIPCIVVPVSYVLAEILKVAGKYQIIVCALLVMIFAGASLKDAMQTHNSNIELNYHPDVNNDSVVEYILANTEKEDRILVMSLNAYYYDATRRFANTKYFIQHYMYDYDYSLYDEIMQDIEENPPKLIIMRKYNVDGEPWGQWMTKFYEDMCMEVNGGNYALYETDFFVAFKLQ